MTRKTVVVIGNGMVGHRFCERLVEFDADRRYRDRHVLRGAAAGLRPRQPDDVLRPPRRRQARCWPSRTGTPSNGIDLHVGDRAAAIDRERKVVRSAQGREIAYDVVVLATGSAPFVPPVPGVDKKGVFVYRTIEDLERIIAYARDGQAGGRHRRRAARPGGGQGGLRPRAGDARRRVRPAADAAAGRRRRLAGAGRQDRGAGRAGPPQQEHQGVPRQRQGRGHGVRRRRPSSTSTWSSSRPASARATSWPGPAA